MSEMSDVSKFVDWLCGKGKFPFFQDKPPRIPQPYQPDKPLFQREKAMFSCDSCGRVFHDVGDLFVIDGGGDEPLRVECKCGEILEEKYPYA